MTQSIFGYICFGYLTHIKRNYLEKFVIGIAPIPELIVIFI